MVAQMVAFLLPLITAHLAGDFLLQSEEDVRNKSSAEILIKHALIIAALSYLLLGLWQAWLVAVVIFFSHMIIDYIKSQTREDSLKVFLLDQCAHLSIIVLTAYLVVSRGYLPSTNYWAQVLGEGYYAVLLVVSGAIICVPAGGIIIGFGVKPFFDQLEPLDATGSQDSNGEERPQISRGFDEGGRTIGWLERALIYVLVLVNQPAGIGFLIAAKSVFRFGELKEGANRMEAEYIIIGTLSSFLYGILVAYLIKGLLAII